MRNAILLSSVFVVSSLVCGSARADDTTQDDAQHGKPGIIATGAVLTAFGIGHAVIAGAAFQSAANCGDTMFCFKDMDNAIGGISAVISGVLLATGIPLIVYGATAKRAPRAQVGVSPTGLFVSGTF